jgi:hypothetical protein
MSLGLLMVTVVFHQHVKCSDCCGVAKVKLRKRDRMLADVVVHVPASQGERGGIPYVEV